ncbi:MAG TPA: hypothetical protein VNJ01_15520 [Bacteriovoracaceae bacterium]|nr:hypothetical protein [Bacteriovoracaceae bacterium]
MFKLLLILFVSISSSFAGWQLEGQVSIDGEDFPIKQSIELGKEYSSPLGSFVFDYSLKESKNKKYLISYHLKEKKGDKLTSVCSGKESLTQSKEEKVYAKGEPGQANSILTFKLLETKE